MGHYQSSIPIRILLRGVSIGGELTRVSAPLTVEAIAARLPLEGPSMLKDDQIQIKVHLKLGVEKPRREMVTGSIGYWPLGDAICLFLRDSSPYSLVSRIGKTTSDPSLIAESAVGSIMRIERG